MKTRAFRLSILAAIHWWGFFAAMGALGFSNTGALAQGRDNHTATLLQNGKVLVAGGYNGNPLASAQLYDPATGIWTATGNLVTARYNHTATLLQNGKVLVAGGQINGGPLATAELYDPASGTWTATGSLTNARFGHTATLLANGRVLVAGGAGMSAELYDPASEGWFATKNNLAATRSFHTATLLTNGKVMVTGGQNGGALQSAELYNPASGTWAATASMTNARYNHTATLLADGKVMVTGGQNGGALLSTEVYDPVSASWSSARTSNLIAARYTHTATLLPNGQVLVTGGFNSTSGYLTSAELYDPATGTWTASTGNLAGARANHTATLLPNGSVLVAAGFNGANTGTAKYLASAEVYDSSNGAWSGTNNFTTARDHHTATLLPNGKVLVAAGLHAGTPTALASAELYDPASGMWTTTTGVLTTGRYFHTATLLPNGKVLVVGGQGSINGNTTILQSAELYDPSSGTWMGTDSLTTARQFHTATLLPNGKVLVAGGINGSALPSAELYDPASGTWSTAPGSLVTPRYDHTATLLPNGKVLIAGGRGTVNGNDAALGSSEFYDPASGLWKATTGSPITPREGFPTAGHTATLLPNGKVLVAGGGVAATELYNPATDTWSATGALAVPREYQTATLLPMGKVLVAGGLSSGNPVNTAELYDVGLGFARPAWQPQIVTAPSTLTLGGSLALTGSLFQGISQASGGNTQDSSTNYPIVQLRSIGNEQSTFLLPAGWSPTTFTSKSVSGFPAGPALVTVFTNGIPSDASYLVVVPPTVLANISTRLLVGTGDNVLIGGFIVSGTQTKKVLIRAIGPSLPLAGVLADPTLELYQGTTLLESNDNWMDSPNKQAIIDSGAAPLNNLESAIVRSVAPGNYTAIERGVNNGTGIGVVEAYDLDTSANSKLANISTRGLVQTGDNVLFAGTIVVGQASQKVIIRALGPSTGVPGAMADPTLELHDGSGTLLETNDNWVDSPNKQAIIDSTIPPPNNAESAIVRILTPGNYTAIVRGVNNSTGIAVVEVYALN
jgi:N-acetylneuraminic acid mutarotase